MIVAGEGSGIVEPASKESAWLRHALASSYLRMGLPALSRKLRERYSLTAVPERKWLPFSWRRRIESSARILYYHRINDDHDPFFPATTTVAFAEQMRFVSQYYRVVSLDEMFKHLNEGAPGSVVAITFDDGYEDNYRNAFPILNQYNLPATIFLATGSIDTGDALWFEQLAYALRDSRCESIDAEECGRFSLETTASRLNANAKIFQMLRAAAEGNRRDQLARILNRLGAAPARARMLSWDQIRSLSARRIVFGGHTVTHPLFSTASPTSVSGEVTVCKRRIEEETQVPVSFFAYPHGDFTDVGKELLHAAGYKAAVTTLWGMNYHSTDPFEWRRGQPWEDDPAVFAWKLDWYQMVNA